MAQDEQMEIIDPETTTLEDIRQLRNDTNNFAKMLGLTVTKLEKGYAEAELKVVDAYRNPQSSIHGGVLMTMADVVASASVAYCKQMIATIEGGLHFLRPVLEEQTLKAIAKEVQGGKNIMVTNVEVFTQDGKLVANGIYTFANLHKPIKRKKTGSTNMTKTMTS